MVEVPLNKDVKVLIVQTRGVHEDRGESMELCPRREPVGGLLCDSRDVSYREVHSGSFTSAFAFRALIDCNSLHPLMLLASWLFVFESRWQ
jgi:hypothetical protein